MFKQSWVNTVNVPGVTPEGIATPALLVQAGETPLRVIVRNVSTLGATISLSYEASSVTVIPLSAGTFTLPPDASEVFVLMPGQKLYAATNSIGGQGRASVGVSPAIPLELKP